MATALGKPQKGDRIVYDFVILGRRDCTIEATVMEWPRYGRVRARIDRVVYQRQDYGFEPGKELTWDEHAAAMYLKSGIVKLAEESDV